MIFERIVCGVDGSPAGLEALRQAAVLCPRDGRLLAVTVCETHLAVRTGFEAASWAETLRSEAKETEAAARREIGDLLFADTLIVEGWPIASLRAIVERENASLIAVGTHGSSRVMGVLLGSVATTMLHEAPCPVLVARPAAGGNWAPRSIVVGFDGSPQSFHAAELGSALAERFRANVRMLAAEGGKPLNTQGLSTINKLEWDRRQPVSALVAASKHADLVIVGGRGVHGVLALGSVSERVAHRAHCSVLVTRPVVEGPAPAPAVARSTST
jgi:nucleotide-binding universal stress UspA family protein